MAFISIFHVNGGHFDFFFVNKRFPRKLRNALEVDSCAICSDGSSDTINRYRTNNFWVSLYGRDRSGDWTILSIRKYLAGLVKLRVILREAVTLHFYSRLVISDFVNNEYSKR